MSIRCMSSSMRNLQGNSMELWCSGVLLIIEFPISKSVDVRVELNFSKERD